jgi:prolyl-tRNA synthetase
MGSYGIGGVAPGRRHHRRSHDDTGIIWPESVAPFKVAILNLARRRRGVRGCQKLYDGLATKGIGRCTTIATCDPAPSSPTWTTIGTPWQVIGPKGLAAGGRLRTARPASEELPLDQVVQRFG